MEKRQEINWRRFWDSLAKYVLKKKLTISLLTHSIDSKESNNTFKEGWNQDSGCRECRDIYSSPGYLLCRGGNWNFGIRWGYQGTKGRERKFTHNPWWHSNSFWRCHSQNISISEYDCSVMF